MQANPRVAAAAVAASGDADDESGDDADAKGTGGGGGLLAYLLDHSSLGLLTPQDALDNGRIRTDLALAGWTGRGGNGDDGDEEAEDDDDDDDAGRSDNHFSGVLLRCRRLRPELFEKSRVAGAAGPSGKRSSMAAAMAARLQEAVPGGNLALSGSAKVLQKLPAVVRMLGSLQPRSQRFPADVAVSEWVLQ